MSIKLILAIVTITTALICYTIGVWTEHHQKCLKPFHVIFFWIGLVFDTTGTTIMSFISRENGGGSLLSAHGITGLIAIILMCVHAVWATVVLAKKQEKQQKVFHRFSVLVWCIWLIPFIIGMMMGMR
ncbi:MAG: HsmA family protein [Lachnospiraceae bacterium]